QNELVRSVYEIFRRHILNEFPVLVLKSLVGHDDRQTFFEASYLEASASSVKRRSRGTPSSSGNRSRTSGDGDTRPATALRRWFSMTSMSRAACAIVYRFRRSSCRTGWSGNV